MFSGNGNGMTEIDKLFAKFVPGQSPTKPAQKMSVDSLFAAALSGGEPLHSPSPGPRASSVVSNRGIALLDSIFASATPTTPPTQTTIHILSPKPTSTTLPQVLNQNVISTLLGLAPSPGGSVSSSGYRYEGDNESTSEDGGFSEGERPKSSAILDEDLEQQAQATRRPAAAARVPSFTIDNLLAAEEAHSSPTAQGDVTPRPALKSMHPPTDLTPSKKRELLHPIQRRDYAAEANPPSGSSHQLKAFEPDSELWPREPLDDRALDTDGDVVELDFNEISALNDPHIFEARVNGKGKKRKERKKEGLERGPVSATPSVDVITAVPVPVKGKGKFVEVLVNGEVRVNKNGAVKTPVNGLDRDVVTDSLLTAAAPLLKPSVGNRNEFVREVLTLIHVGFFPFV